MTDQPSERLREHPERRFAPREAKFDLTEAVEKLRAEPSGEHGHKQVALFKHGPETLALFLFEDGSKLPEHVVDGTVFIQVLSGRLTVRTSEAVHDLPRGSLLRLSPGVVHDVEAEGESQMLLTVCLEGPRSGEPGA